MSPSELRQLLADVQAGKLAVEAAAARLSEPAVGDLGFATLDLHRKERCGFHDLRRGFATMNADRLTADVLQAMMHHQNYTTTQRYIALARQLRPSVLNMFTADLTAAATQGGYVRIG